MKQSTALSVLQAGHNVFLTGEAGAGKSYTLRQFINDAHEREINIAVTASSGIAATILSGSTVHSYTQIGIKQTITATDLYSIRRKLPIANRLRNLQVLIIDEISMLHARQFDMINFVLKSIRKDFRPFGGVQIVVAGDFFQLPPVGPEPAKERFAFMSRSWIEAGFKICYLTEQHRQGTDELSGILNAIRHDTINDDHLNSLIDSYNNQLSESPTTLYTHNADVDKLNVCRLQALETPVKCFKALTTGSKADVDFLCANVLSPPELDLKVGAKVMFTKNDPEGAYVNGTLGTVISLEYGSPIVRTLEGINISADRQTWEKQDEFGVVKATYCQVPLRLAWAITVHKSQGLTLDEAFVDLSKCFELGQGYVALSRLKSLKRLQLVGINEKALKLDPLARKADNRFKILSEEVAQEFGEIPD